MLQKDNRACADCGAADPKWADACLILFKIKSLKMSSFAKLLTGFPYIFQKFDIRQITLI
ncbi:hypothetical protein RchiOBHm_Chr7g0181921 [Rosa chinensis]|uniref:Uncharacterized protein n=1 Tax=Rosa chinensis TaxID=74649 RepID=A0A2P6P2R7_ROSCH|nr:hypothetical protein RchiOBHm_Chr7g0181921 [Rosa chinensis]